MPLDFHYLVSIRQLPLQKGNLLLFHRKLLFVHVPKRLIFDGIMHPGKTRLGYSIVRVWCNVVLVLLVVEGDSSLLQHAEFFVGEDSRWNIVLSQQPIVIVNHLNDRI